MLSPWNAGWPVRPLLKPVVMRVCTSALTLMVALSASGCSWIDERLSPLPVEVVSEPAAVAVGERLPPGDSQASADGSPPRLGGRHGSGMYGPVFMDIIEVNRSGRRLSVSVTLTNIDWTNPARVDASEFVLVISDGEDEGEGEDDDGEAGSEAVVVEEVVQAEVVTGGRGPVLDPGARSTKTVNFLVDGEPSLNDIALQYGPGTVPLRMPLIGFVRPLPYPIEVASGVSSTYQGSGDCPVQVEMQRAFVDLALPLSVERPPTIEAQAPAGHRWLVMMLAVSLPPPSSDSSGEEPAGEPCPAEVVPADDLLLRLDPGEEGTEASLGAELLTLASGEEVDRMIAWPVALGATSVELPLGSLRLDLPPMPSLPGE